MGHSRKGRAGVPALFIGGKNMRVTIHDEKGLRTDFACVHEIKEEADDIMICYTDLHDCKYKIATLKRVLIAHISVWLWEAHT